MEDFEIMYNGQKVIVEKEGNKYKAILPISSEDSKLMKYRYITVDDFGWRHTTGGVFERGIGKLDVWLTGDKKILYSKGMSDYKMEYGDFVPNSETEDQISKNAQEIYDVASKILEYEYLTVPASEVIQLRKDRIVSVMKMLGAFIDKSGMIGIDPDKSYKCLGKIGKQLENYESLNFVRGDETSPEGYVFAPTTGSTKRQMTEAISRVKEEIEENNKFMEVQDEFYDRASAIYPEYLLGMKEYLGEIDWKKYSTEARETIKLYLDLNADLFSTETRELMGIKDLSKLDSKQVADRISDLIDSRDFDRACNLEDQFVMRECENFSVAIDRMGAKDEDVRNTSVGFSLESLRREALATRAKKDKYNTKFVEMEKLFESKIDTKDNEKNGVEYDE